MQRFYSVSIVVYGKLCERSNVLLQDALPKSNFNHDFLFVALHHVLAFIFLLEGTFEEVGFDVVGVTNL